MDSEGKAAAAYDVKDQAILFLPLEGGSGFRTINESLLQNEETLEFIERIGIDKPSLRDEIYTIILPKYKDAVSISTMPDFKKFFQYYLSCSHPSIMKSFLDLLRSKQFVLCRRKGEKTQYRAMPGSVYFPNELLRSWFVAKPEVLFVCFDEYIELVGENNKEELVSFLTDLGVKNMPRILTMDITETKASEARPSTGWEQHYHFYTYKQKWEETYIDGCEEILATSEDYYHNTKIIWKVLLDLISTGVLRQSTQKIKYTYWYGNNYSKNQIVESLVLRKLRTAPWLLNKDGKFVSASELTVQTISPQYDVSYDDAPELFRILGIAEEVDVTIEDVDISTFAKSHGYTEEDVKRLIEEDLKRRKEAEESEAYFEFDDEDDKDVEDATSSDDGDDAAPRISRSSIKRVGKEITKRATSMQEHPQKADDSDEDAPTDEDDYSKPTVDISKKIEKVKEQAERDIQKIARLEDLKQKAQEAEPYSYGWFNALLELESLNSGENNANSREISISFAKVEREVGTSRTLVLKNPSRYIPQSIEDLADIPLELYCGGQLISKPAIEVVNIKSYTLRVKLRTNADIGDIDLSTITEARIVARNPVFLIEELRKAFIRLGEENGYDDDYDMQGNLCENIEFVFGPPGTGKTTHVAKKIILPMMKSPKDLKVLVLTPTNKSADVLVRRLMECMGSDHNYLNWLVRFGTTNDNDIEQSGVFRDKVFEASMIPLANIVYPLFKKTPTKFFIAGDPFQIEPITTVDTWKNENIYTMVKLNSFTKPTTVPHDYHVELLTTQYRSIPEIGEVFSKFAYGGVLKHHRAADNQRPLPIGDLFDLKPLNIIKFPVSNYESIYRPK